MKKRVIAMVLTGMMAVGLLAGCSTASSDSSSETDSQTEQEQVTKSSSTEMESTESEGDLETTSSESETEAGIGGLLIGNQKYERGRRHDCECNGWRVIRVGTA